MAIVLIAIWLAFLQVLVVLKVLKGWSLWMKLSPVIIYLSVFLMIIVPMNFAAPVGSAVAVKNSVEVAPGVSGFVSEVVAEPGADSVKAGDVLFRINPVMYQSRVDELEAQLELAQIRQKQAKDLLRKKAGRAGDVQTYDAEVKQLQARLAGASKELELAEIKAPVDGYIPTLLLRDGTWVNAGQPLLRLVESSENYVAVAINQANVRHVETGQGAEVILKRYPGQVFQAEVVQVLQANQSGLWDPSTDIRPAADPQVEPVWVTLRLPDDINLPAGSAGQATIFTNEFAKSHVIRRIMLRMDTWLNFIKP